jgi:predicted RNase H-like nuclease
MVDRAARLDRPALVDLLDRYRSQRPKGDKEHLRSTDQRFGALSPMKVYGTPLAKMFHEGAPRLRRSSLNVVPVRPSADRRTAIEAYPGAAVRSLLGRRSVSYKNDIRRKQTAAHEAVRSEILTALRGQGAQRVFGFHIVAFKVDLSVAVDDPSGDVLDSLLCASQAAWSWQRRKEGWGVPAESDLLEGWICHPQDAIPGATRPRTPT